MTSSTAPAADPASRPSRVVRLAPGRVLGSGARRALLLLPVALAGVVVTTPASGGAATVGASTRAPATAASVAAAAAAPRSSTCADVIVYVVRGSGEAPKSGPDTTAFDPADPTNSYIETWDAFDPVDPGTGGSSIDAGVELEVEGGTATPRTGTPFLYDLVEKVHRRVGGQVKLSWSPVSYPAVPVEVGPLWLFDGYPASVAAGIRELDRVLQRQWELCGKHTRYVLAGYSQGADVVSSYLRGTIVDYPIRLSNPQFPKFIFPSSQVAGQIAAAALIADPNHDPRDAESYSDVDDHLSARGGLSNFTPSVGRRFASLSDSMCIAGDSVCGQGMTVTPERERGDAIHGGGYIDGETYPVRCAFGPTPGPTESAIACLADRIVWRLGLRNLVLEPLDEAGSAPGATGRDVAFFVDTTGSMSDDIEAARRFASSQASRIVAIDGRVALVEYRDRGDSPPVRIVTPFTSDIAEFEAGLSSLVADGGGDTPEALLHALMTGLDELEWQYGATKASVVLSDAGFHEPDRVGGETLSDVERRALQIDPVNIFPVVDSRSSYSEMAAATSGEVIDKRSGDTEAALGRALDSIAERPVALLSNGTSTAAAGRSVHFDASGSTSANGEVVQYVWDFDGDGTQDRTTSTPEVDHRYPAGYSGLMQVLVFDEQGYSANASATVLVEEEPVPGPEVRVPGAGAMQVDAASADENVALEISWSAGRERPTRWVVAANGDPVRVVPGSVGGTTAAVPFQDERWTVTLTPMDARGNLGPAFSAELEALPEPHPWYERPVVLGAGVAAGLLTALLLLLARRRQRRSQPGGGA